MKPFFVFIMLFIVTINAQNKKYSYFYNDEEIILKPSDEKYFVKFKDDFTHIKQTQALLQYTTLDSICEREGKYFIIKDNGKTKDFIDKAKSLDRIEFIMPVFIFEDRTEVSVKNQFIVNFRNDITIEQINQLNKENGLKISKKLDETDGKSLLLELVDNNSLDVFELCEKYNGNSLVKHASPNFIVLNGLCSTNPDDEYYNNQWVLQKVNAPNAWDITTGNSSIIVAVLDNGIDLAHDDFVNKLVQGWNCVEDNNNPQAVGGFAHGTACAGIIAASTNNVIGIAGIAWNCKIMPIRVGSGNGWEYADLIQGINYAKDYEAQILSISLGTLLPDNNLTNTINNAANNGRNGKGCVIVAAAGNSETPNAPVKYPANLGNVLAVGSTTQYDKKWDYSRTGSSLNIVAPSGAIGDGNGDVWTTDISGPTGLSTTDYTGTFGGTSAACPLVAGLAALILSKNPNLTRIQVQTIIEQAAIDLGASGRDDDYGWGRIDAWNALRKTTSGTLPGHEVWRDTVNLTGNITVPSGIKLTVLSNAIINLNNFSIISSEGSINVESGATINGLRAKVGYSGQYGLCGSIQTAINNSSYNNNIETSEKLLRYIKTF
jgi:thermitase